MGTTSGKQPAILARLQEAMHQNQGRVLFDEPEPSVTQDAPAVRKRQCTTDKVRFATEQQAWDAVVAMRDRGLSSRGYAPHSVISCPKCNGFHLTSKPAKRWAAGKPRRAGGARSPIR